MIYPSRAADCPDFEAPPEHLARNDKPFTIAFAGTINSNGYIRRIDCTAKCAEACRWTITYFWTIDIRRARQVGLDDPNTEMCGLLSCS